MFFAFSSATAAVYTISYNANGGSSAPSAQTKDGGIDLTLSSTASQPARVTPLPDGTPKPMAAAPTTPAAQPLPAMPTLRFMHNGHSKEAA